MQFYLTSLRGKEFLANLTNSQEPEPIFWPLGAGAGAAKNLAGSPAPVGGAGLFKLQSSIYKNINLRYFGEIFFYTGDIFFFFIYNT